MNNNIIKLTQTLEPITSGISNHPLYEEIAQLENLRFFMEQHVFAVWDFMCLLKELHRKIVCTKAPWFPPKDAYSANLISSILVEEEGDIAADGTTYTSHFQLYIDAMEKIGANTQPIKSFLGNLQAGNSLTHSFKAIKIESFTKEFVHTTFSFFECKVHELAAAFVFGREAITPNMFLPLVNQLKVNAYTPQLDTLIYYLERHIELDNNEHLPKALQMLANLNGNDKQKWQETEVAALKALKARNLFLSGIHQAFVAHQAAA